MKTCNLEQMEHLNTVQMQRAFTEPGPSCPLQPTRCQIINKPFLILKYISWLCLRKIPRLPSTNFNLEYDVTSTLWFCTCIWTKTCSSGQLAVANRFYPNEQFNIGLTEMQIVKLIERENCSLEFQQMTRNISTHFVIKC